MLAGVAWVPFVDGLHPFHGQVMQLDASPVDLGVTDPSGVVVGLGWFCAKDVRAEDRLEFDEDEPDAFGLPAIRIRYRLTSRDRAHIEAAMAQQRRAAQALGGFIPGGEPRLLPAGTSLHYQGTVRMGESDDGTSVCDPASAVWGVPGLYVGGNGVIPTPPPATRPSAASRSPSGPHAPSPSRSARDHRRRKHMGPMDKDVVRDDALHATGDGFALDIRSHWYRSLPLTSLADARPRGRR